MIAGPEDPNSRAGHPTRTRCETLDYITEIVEELKRLADRDNHRTLAALLGAALTEARQQIQQQERR